MEECDCLVPAAGRSERMGGWKPVMPFRGSTIVETVVANALGSCARVVLVTGYRGVELAELFRREPRVLAVDNPDWPLGMFSSIQCGIALVRTSRFFVTPGDMPWILPDVYEALLRGAPADVVVPVFDGSRGHPVLFHERVKDDALAADPAAATMREIASRFAVRELAWKDGSILRDIDTMEDYP